jgi:FKBP-type peptidyl-prolyl cis-trans isomerase
MKSKLQTALILTALTAMSAISGEETSHPTPSAPPDKQKVSYALGMNFGLQRKKADPNLNIAAFTQGLKDMLEGKPTQVQESEIPELLTQARLKHLANEPSPAKDKVSYSLGMRMGGQLTRVTAEVDADAIAEGLRDVVEGKPTKIKESDIEPLFHQSKEYGLIKQSEKNKAEGEAYLAKNAKVPGIKILPSGLQYQIITEGSGEKPKDDDLTFIKYRGKLINGKEFDHSDRYLTRITGGLKGWQEAMQRMVVGSKWQIFVPSELGFGHEGEPARQVGPDSVLIYELEILSIAKPGDPLIGTGSLGHGLEGEISTATYK